jgi:hypothetical protein
MQDPKTLDELKQYVEDQEPEAVLLNSEWSEKYFGNLYGVWKLRSIAFEIARDRGQWLLRIWPSSKPDLAFDFDQLAVLLGELDFESWTKWTSRPGLEFWMNIWKRQAVQIEKLFSRDAVDSTANKLREIEAEQQRLFWKR